MKSLYRLYIDESGGPSYKNCDNPEDRYLGLTGIIVEKEIYRKIYKELESLKEENFDYDPDEPIILHRKDIINKKGPFKVLQDSKKEKKFNDDLINFLKDQDYKIIVVVIDKKSHKDKYDKSALHPYHYNLTAMLERYCGLLDHINYRGDVLAESRGGKEDRDLEKAYRIIYNFGSFPKYREGPFFQKTLTSKEIKIKKKKHNIAGLQIADLLAHPCKKEVLYEEGRIPKPSSPFANIILAAIKSKYNSHFYNGTLKR